MTRFVKLIGLMMIVVLATSGCQYIHRNIRGMINHSRMERYGRAMEFRHMRNMSCGQMGPDDHFMFERPGHWMSGNRWNGRMPGMRDGMGMGPAYGMRKGMPPMGRGNMRIERIPGLTDSQRKEIADLRQKQMQEMDKLREETFAKMQSLREENRTKMMSLLTAEQKKFLDSGPSSTRPGAPSVSK